MRLPIRRLTKAQLEILNSGNCKHGHSYLEHYKCFLDEKPDHPLFQERIGFLDIEATGLKGNWDYMLCYCIKKLNGEILGRPLTTREIRSYKFDQNLIQELVRDLGQFDRVATFYGARYDLPFIRTRAEDWGVNFPLYRDLWSTDVYFIARSKLLLHSNRLQHVCDLMGIPSKGHKLDPKTWRKAQAGHKESLEWIFEHCKEDVTSLEEVWKRLIKYSMPRKESV